MICSHPKLSSACRRFDAPHVEDNDPVRRKLQLPPGLHAVTRLVNIERHAVRYHVEPKLPRRGRETAASEFILYTIQNSDGCLPGDVGGADNRIARVRSWEHEAGESVRKELRGAEPILHTGDWKDFIGGSAAKIG